MLTKELLELKKTKNKAAVFQTNRLKMHTKKVFLHMVEPNET